MPDGVPSAPRLSHGTVCLGDGHSIAGLTGRCRRRSGVHRGLTTWSEQVTPIRASGCDVPRFQPYGCLTNNPL